jgi:hypothetical protein
MSDEPNKQERKRPVFIPVALALLAVYPGVHYATSTVTFRSGVCCGICVHAIGRHPVPDWAEQFFWMADRIDGVIGVQPYRDPTR